MALNNSAILVSEAGEWKGQALRHGQRQGQGQGQEQSNRLPFRIKNDQLGR